MRTLIFLYFLISFSANGQAIRKIRTDLALQIETISKLFEAQGSYNMFEEDNTLDITAVNEAIAKRLVRLLQDKRTYSLDVQDLPLAPEVSDDQQLRLFTWFENTGGSNQSSLTVVQYRTRSGVVGAYFLKDKDCAPTAYYEKPFKLKNTTKDLYVAIGAVRTCNSCTTYYAVVFQVTDKYLITNYPAFNGNSACLTLSGRVGSIEEFKYDPIQQEIHYLVSDDDIAQYDTEEKNEQGQADVTLRFDGKSFVQIR